MDSQKLEVYAAFQELHQVCEWRRKGAADQLGV